MIRPFMSFPNAMNIRPGGLRPRPGCMFSNETEGFVFLVLWPEITDLLVMDETWVTIFQADPPDGTRQGNDLAFLFGQGFNIRED